MNELLDALQYTSLDFMISFSYFTVENKSAVYLCLSVRF